MLLRTLYMTLCCLIFNMIFSIGSLESACLLKHKLYTAKFRQVPLKSTPYCASNIEYGSVSVSNRKLHHTTYRLMGVAVSLTQQHRLLQ